MRARRLMIGAMFVFTPGTFFAQSPAPKTSRTVGIVVDSILDDNCIVRLVWTR